MYFMRLLYYTLAVLLYFYFIFYFFFYLFTSLLVIENLSVVYSYETEMMQVRNAIVNVTFDPIQMIHVNLYGTHVSGMSILCAVRSIKYV